ncbi:hypothetical protein MLD38_014742 [Melastoma candidum]|uniref:Uncharacterized protein n=1 Tax=Melastoma candidum TaxID=119954 RepID=A0ACB9RFM0_9MYRT|nr:hypothetical protein MLD38_014742 [Melastoma candidum]
MRRFSIIANQSQQCISYCLSSDHSDTDTVRRVLEPCRQQSDFQNAAAGQGKIIKVGTSILSAVASQISAYVRSESVGLHQKVFDELPVRYVVTWNTMIWGLMNNGEFEVAIGRFRDMMGEKAELDAFTFASVFTAYSISKRVFDSVPHKDVSVWNTMIKGLAIHGHGQHDVALFYRTELNVFRPMHLLRS